MFPFITKTWNPLGGKCQHQCVYCWSMGEKGLVNQYNMEKYHGNPFLVEKELHRKFSKDDFVFVQDMSDLFADNVPMKLILRIFEVVTNQLDTKFLFLTKNPKRYWSIIRKIGEGHFPPNAILGTTIETNLKTANISLAPQPNDRLNALMDMPFTKFVSIEPILKFDLNEFENSLANIPCLESVAVGYDNYGYKLPEPTLAQTLQLIEKLVSWATVYPKTLRKAWWEK